MNKPIVAIVGRANVGKSTFFNKICGRRISIVDDVAGVTRDRLYADASWCGKDFTIVDTGGVELNSEDVFKKEIIEQVMLAIENATVAIGGASGNGGKNPAALSGIVSRDNAGFLEQNPRPQVIS